MESNVRVICTIVFEVIEDKMFDTIDAIQEFIKTLPEIDEYGFNIYDIREVPE